MPRLTPILLAANLIVSLAILFVLTRPAPLPSPIPAANASLPPTQPANPATDLATVNLDILLQGTFNYARRPPIGDTIPCLGRGSFAAFDIHAPIRITDANGTLIGSGEITTAGLVTQIGDTRSCAFTATADLDPTYRTFLVSVAGQPPQPIYPHQFDAYITLTFGSKN
jgi:hypothetical protein